MTTIDKVLVGTTMAAVVVYLLLKKKQKEDCASQGGGGGAAAPAPALMPRVMAIPTLVNTPTGTSGTAPTGNTAGTSTGGGTGGVTPTTTTCPPNSKPNTAGGCDCDAGYVKFGNVCIIPQPEIDCGLYGTPNASGGCDCKTGYEFKDGTCKQIQAETNLKAYYIYNTGEFDTRQDFGYVDARTGQFVGGSLAAKECTGAVYAVEGSIVAPPPIIAFNTTGCPPYTVARSFTGKAGFFDFIDSMWA